MKNNTMVDFYHLHFFKIKDRNIDIELVVDFFAGFENIDYLETDETFEILYKVEKLNINVDFVFTKKSRIVDLTEINPKFLEVKFHVKFPIITSDYSANQIFDIVRKLCDRFDLYVYNELFTDVLEYKLDTIMHSFKIMKDKYIEVFPQKLKDKILISSNRLNDILRYTHEQEELAKYYKDDNIVVPPYFFVRDKLGKLYVCMELREHTNTVFPPKIDLVYYHYNNLVKIINYNSLLDKVTKYLNEVPGFIPGTKVLHKKRSKKVHKIIRKTKFTPPNNEFDLVELKDIIDL